MVGSGGWGLLEAAQETVGDPPFTQGPEGAPVKGEVFSLSTKGGEVAWASGKLPGLCRRGVPQARVSGPRTC